MCKKRTNYRMSIKKEMNINYMEKKIISEKIKNGNFMSQKIKFAM